MGGGKGLPFFRRGECERKGFVLGGKGRLYNKGGVL